MAEGKQISVIYNVGEAGDVVRDYHGKIEKAKSDIITDINTTTQLRKRAFEEAGTTHTLNFMFGGVCIGIIDIKEDLKPNGTAKIKFFINTNMIYKDKEGKEAEEDLTISWVIALMGEENPEWGLGLIRNYRGRYRKLFKGLGTHMFKEMVGFLKEKNIKSVTIPIDYKNVEGFFEKMVDKFYHEGIDFYLQF